MSKISEVITLHTGYASAVNLREEFLDAEKNRSRMTRYKPTKAHREVFERLSRCLHPKDKRCYLLTGSYGTGKSHLLLMFANYLGNKSDTPEMVSFFAQYAAVEPGKAENLKALRAKGRYLIAICDYETKDDFEEIVLRAIVNACVREEFEGVIDTHYHEAVRCIEDWEARSKSGTSRLDIYAAFAEELVEKYPDYTVNKLKAALNGFKEEALVIFKELHQSILGLSFTYDKGNLVAILKDLLSSRAFVERYQGLAILFDEFGYTLENSRLSLNVFQEFAQLCTQGSAGCQPVLFIGTGHRAFASYAKGWTQQDFTKVSDRIAEIGLTPEGIEDIMGAIVEPKTTHPLWVRDIQPRSGLFNTFLQDCKRLDLFNWLKAPEIRTKIIENVYPVHPMATYCLLRMSTEVGSNNRTVFTFLSGEFTQEEGSYPWFIEAHEVLSGEYLNFYTVDQLTTYFRTRLSSSNKELRDAVRKYLLNYETSLREFKKVAGSELFGGGDPLAERILRTMLVYEICGLQNTEDNLTFGLYCKGDAERKAVTNRLKALCEAKILYLHPTARTYEFRRTDSVDFESLIAEYKADENNLPANLAEAVVTVHPLAKGEDFLIAHDYNTAYSEDKRLRRVFALPSHLTATREENGVTLDSFAFLDQQIEGETEWKKGYEGVAVYVLCETTAEVEKACAVVKSNQSKRVIVAVPREPIPLYDALIQWVDGEYPNATFQHRTFSTDERAFLNDLYDRFSGEKGAAGTQRTVQEVMTALKMWWERLPNICKATDLYPPSGGATVAKLMDATNQQAMQDAQSFLFGALLAVYGYDTDDAVTAERCAELLPRLTNDKETIEGGYDRVKNAILKEVQTLFDVAGHTYDDLKQGVTDWFNDLDANQRDPMADWHENESKPLVMHLGAITNVEETLLRAIPSSGGFGLDKVANWTKDRTGDYLAKFKRGKAHIEANRIKVLAPAWKVAGDIVEEKTDRKAAQIHYRKTARIQFGDLPKGAKVFVTMTDEDPRQANAQRQEFTTGEELPWLTGNRQLCFVLRDAEGNYSPVTTVRLINEDAKHEIHLPLQAELKETTVQFVFPEDVEGLRVSARTLLESAIQYKVVDEKTVQALLLELAEAFGAS